MIEKAFTVHYFTGMKETAIRAKSNPYKADAHDQTIKATLKKMTAATSTNAEVKTEARKRETNDLLNYLASAAIVEAFQTGTLPQYVINEDAVQYQFGKNSALIKVVYIRRFLQNEPLARETIEEDNENCLFVKVVNQISAFGFCAPALSMIADETLSGDTFKVIMLKGVSYLHDPKAYSYLMWVPTRGGTPSAYNWYIKNVVIPYIIDCKEATGLENAPVYYTIDGEDIVLKEFMQLEIRKTLADLLVVLAKGGASMSSVNNAADAGNIHKATKKKNKHSPISDALISREGMQAHLDKLLADEVPHIPKAKRNAQVNGIIRLIYIYQCVLIKSIIQHSFIKSGQANDGSAAVGKFSLYDAQIKLFPGLITQHQVDLIQTNKDELVSIARQNGKIKDSEFVALGFELMKSNDKRTAPKDERPLPNQRHCIINHEYVSCEYDKYRSKKEMPPQARKEQALINKNKKKEEKLEQQRLAREEKAAAKLQQASTATSRARTRGDNVDNSTHQVHQSRQSKEELALSNIANRKQERKRTREQAGFE
jgi:hypothetical protein